MENTLKKYKEKQIKYKEKPKKYKETNDIRGTNLKKSIS